MFAFLQQYFNRNSELADFINSTLASVESLAQDEIGPDDCWLQPETKRCTLQLGGGWFTSSVERVCVFCAVPYCIIILLIFFYSCQSKSKKEYGLSQIENIVTENLQTIVVEVEDFDFEKLGNFLETTSYIQLAAEPLLTSIQEVQIKNEKIYVHDRLSRIICYDMQGNVIYIIDAKGAGPGEYTNVNAFVVNEQNRELVIFDNFRQSLFYYDADNGAYIKMQKLGKHHQQWLH